MKAFCILGASGVALIAGVFIYWFRCRQQFYYGLTEVVFGIAVFVISAFPASTTLITEETSPTEMMISKYLTLAAGLYVVVRGFDNIDKAKWPEVLKPQRSLWDQLFHRS